MLTSIDQQWVGIGVGRGVTTTALNTHGRCQEGVVALCTECAAANLPPRGALGAGSGLALERASPRLLYALPSGAQ